jgi:uncharacterized HAD superfamily protein
MPEPGGVRNIRTYERFLASEYDNIASAHFNTVNSISSFFKHYLLILSLPLPLLAAIISLSKTNPFSNVPFALPFIATTIALTGLLVVGYVINLRHDAILYARTINGLRAYYANTSGLTYVEESRVRVLPRSRHVPRYLEDTYFLFVVAAFALLDSAYFAGGWEWYFGQRNWPLAESIVLTLSMTIALLVLHFLLYLSLSQYRENSYLRSRIIGVDIDGVLADHRPHFCQLLLEATEVDIDPEKITRIPVHECEDLDVNEQQEYRVFNDPNYWITMPVIEEAEYVLSRLRNVLGFKVYVFSHRDWPLKINEDPRHEELIEQWKEASRSWEKRAIKNITKKWLKDKGFQIDRLMIEKGNVYTLDPDSRTRNRFIQSAKKEIRIFVEDDLEKAKKLALICELVFLIEHPYNRREYGDDETSPDDWHDRDDPELPNNVISVKGWQEIYKYVRSVF